MYVWNPRATDCTCGSSKMTGDRLSADLAARRVARSCESYASERRSEVLVAGPKRNSSHDPTKSDHEPRGSFGNQNPYAEKMTWDASTIIHLHTHTMICLSCLAARGAWR